MKNTTTLTVTHKGIGGYWGWNFGFGKRKHATNRRRGCLANTENVVTGLLLAIFLGASQARAEVQLLSANRHVNVSAFASAHEGSTSASDSAVADLFSEFHANKTAQAFWLDQNPNPLGGGPDEADCTATAKQDSILSSAGLDILSFVHVDGGSNLDSDGFPMINADALSFFQVSFRVTAPIVFNLSLFDARGYITGVGSTYEQAFDLTGDKVGSVLGNPIVVGNTQFFSGLLNPGQMYTFSLSQHATTILAAPTGVHVDNTLEAHLTFADVPEPSVYISLLIGICVLVIARAKVFRITRCAVRASDLPGSRVARVARLRSRRRPQVAKAQW
jgi:hypothetical protein